jgi:hypothetical protein
MRRYVQEGVKRDAVEYAKQAEIVQRATRTMGQVWASIDDEMDGLLSLPARTFLEVLQDLRRRSRLWTPISKCADYKAAISIPDSTMAFRNSLYLRRQKTPDLRANEEFLIFSDKNRQEKLWPTGSMNSHDTEPRFHDQIGCNPTPANKFDDGSRPKAARRDWLDRSEGVTKWLSRKTVKASLWNTKFSKYQCENWTIRKSKKYCRLAINPVRSEAISQYSSWPAF